MSEYIVGGDKATMLHPAMLAYRDMVHLTPSCGWRRDIVVTVGDEPDDLAIWLATLREFKRLGWNSTPRNNGISNLIQAFERRKENIDRERRVEQSRRYA